MKIYKTLVLVIFLVANVALLSACGKSKKEVQAEVDRAVENSLAQEYLGMKFINLVKTDKSTLPKIAEFTSQIKECNFKNNQFLDRTSSTNCSKVKIKPEVTSENFNMDAENFGDSVSLVFFAPVDIGNTKLFDHLPGVEKVEFKCTSKSLEDDHFYVIVKDDIPKFTIKETFTFDNSGEYAETTIYFGLVNNDCTKVAAFEELRSEKSKKQLEEWRLPENQKLIQEQVKKEELKKEARRREEQRREEQRREEQAQAQANALKIPDNLDFSGLSTKEKKYAEALKEVAFCTGYTKEAIPNASLNSCGIVSDDIAVNIQNVASCTTALWKQEHIKLQKVVQSFSSDPFFYGKNQNEYYSVYITGVFAFRNRFSKTSEYEYANEFCRVKMEKMLERANKPRR
jgi:hypothetical protein